MIFIVSTRSTAWFVNSSLAILTTLEVQQSSEFSGELVQTGPVSVCLLKGVTALLSGVVITDRTISSATQFIHSFMRLVLKSFRVMRGLK